MITAQHVTLYDRLRVIGATDREAREVLLAVQAAERAADVIELAHTAAWLHEHRDSHGKWEHGSPSAASVAEVHKRARAAQRIRQQSTDAAAAKAAEEARRSALKAAAHSHQQGMKAQVDIVHGMEQRVASAAHGEVQKALFDIKSDQQKLAEMAKTEVKKASRVKFLSHMGFAAAGAIMGVIEAKTGTPDIVAIMSTVGPTAGLEIVDWVKRL